MFAAHNQFVHQPLSISPPQMMKRVWTYSLCVVIGVGLLIGLLIGIPIVLAIGLYKLNQRGVSLQLILGLSICLGAAAVWMLGRFLFTRARRLLRSAESPELSPLLTYASAVFAVVCL